MNVSYLFFLTCPDDLMSMPTLLSFSNPRTKVEPFCDWRHLHTKDISSSEIEQNSFIVKRRAPTNNLECFTHTNFASLSLSTTLRRQKHAGTLTVTKLMQFQNMLLFKTIRVLAPIVHIQN